MEWLRHSVGRGKDRPERGPKVDFPRIRRGKPDGIVFAAPAVKHLRRALVYMPDLQKNQLHTVTITGYTAEGLGVARIDGQVVFIHNAVRGEVCAVRILKVQKNGGSRTAPATPPAAAATSGMFPMRRSWRPSGSGLRTPCAG